MNDKSRFSRSVLATMKQLSLVALTAVFMVALPVASNAQETTSAIRGSITASDGSAAAGATIEITDTRTGRVSRTTSSASGQYQVGDLSVGGPFTVVITMPDHASHTVTDVFINLGETFNSAISLSPESIEEIVVTAAVVQVTQVALGPATSFSFDDLQNMPAINRDINDIVRADPRVYIDRAFVDAVQCVGANPRFNSLTVDGVKKNDNFGLNSNGYPTQRMPFPFDAIEQVSVELSPFDVQYGGFTACNVNAVTRSGTNSWTGRVWASYGDDGFVGTSLEGDNIDQGSFDDTRWGFSAGGPIVKDKFFFHFTYEKRDSADIFDRCAGDQSCGRPVEGVTQAQLDRIAQIAVNTYGYDPGATILSRPNEDEKYFLRLDWTINDDHNAAFTYNFNDGFNTSQSDSDSDEYEFSNHFYERGAELTAYNLMVFSDWTDRFTTEFKVGYSELDNRQETINNQGFGEVRIETYADVDGDGNESRANVYLGGDDSRQSNDLDYSTLNLKLAGNYAAGDHLWSLGYQMEEVDIFNLFLQHTIGEYRFDEERTDDNGATVGCNFGGNFDGCIDQFEALSPDDIYYGNAAPSLDPNDAAAEFAYAVNTVFIQDEITFPNSDFILVAGLRYDWYTSSDLPTENSNFIARTGFTNRKNFDGLDLLQPRLGFSWGINDDLILRGGFGLYGGGNPNVWLGNNYQNDGITQVQAREGDGDVDDLNTNPDRWLGSTGADPVPLGVDGNGQPVFDAPQTMIDFVANGTANSGVNAIDPGFEIPANWKLSLGASWIFGDGFELNGDVIFSRSENSAIIRDDTYVQTGVAPDGRPIYYQADKSVAGCDTDPIGTGSACDRLFNGDYILDNVQGSDGEQFSFSTTLSKSHDFGLDWTLGYAFTDSTEVSPMTSSVAFSNYFNISVADPNDPGVATANYEMQHRFIAKLGYQAEWFGNNVTRFTLFGAANKGRPYSATFSEQEMFVCGPFFCPDDDRSLLYMPDGRNDPNVVFDPSFDQDAFFAWAEGKGLTKYGGGIVKRNELASDWWTKFDLRISQEIPGFRDHKASIYFTIENLGNLINDEWGVLYERSFPRAAPVVQASLVNDQYVFEEYIPQSQSRSTRASLWKMRIGFQYNF